MPNNFVVPMPEEVQTECSICLHVLKEPCMVGCCGYRFCRSCIEKVGRTCPLCNRRNFQHFPDKQLQRLLNQRKVYCLLKDDGCPWEGEMQKAQEHLNTENSLVDSDSCCQFYPIECDFSCGALVRRRDVSAHKTVCIMRPVVCEHCNDFSAPLIYIYQHYNTCPLFPVRCPNACSNEIHKRQDLRSHLESDCPLEEIECEYNYAGCTGKILRRDMDQHMVDNASYHLSRVSSKCKEMLEENESLKESLAWKESVKEIGYIYVSNLPELATEQMIRSRFGQHGGLQDVEMLSSSIIGKAAVVRYSSKHAYDLAVTESQFSGMNLLGNRLCLHPIYTSNISTSCTSLPFILDNFSGDEEILA